MWNEAGRGGVRAVLAGLVLASAASAQITTFVGKPGGGSVECREPDITPDGRFVAYDSSQTGVVAGDTNQAYDVFAHDRVLDTVVRVSVASDGTEASAQSYNPSISDDGTRVAFESYATNLVPGDTNNQADVFVHDLTTGVTTRVSVSSLGAQASGVSLHARISGDGRFVTFESNAPDLVVGDTNGQFDVFVHDLVLATTTRVSVSSFGLQGDSGSRTPSISSNGRFVAFESDAITLALNDLNGFRDVFVRDRALGQTTLVSRSTTGVPSDGISFLADISGDGSHVVFASDASTFDAIEFASNDRDIFVHEIATGTTRRASVDEQGGEASGYSTLPRISETGRYVCFQSYAIDLVAMPDTNGEPDIFVRDMQDGVTRMVSLATNGTVGLSGSFSDLTADGRWVVFDDIVLYLRDTFIPWSDLGAALAGAGGTPSLVGQGTLEPNTIVSLTLSDAAPSTTVFLVGGPALLQAPFEGGTMIPQPIVILGLASDPAGGFFFPVLWPPSVPSGASYYLQCWIPDSAGIYGYASSNGLALTQP